MKNEDLNSIWIELESNRDQRHIVLQRLIYVHLLWRVYIGCGGFPSRRFLSLEIPQKEKKEFDSFVVPQGFTLTIGEPGVGHEGFAACILESSSSDQNDVFTILSQDILEELSNQSESSIYISTLKRRIEKWRDFFKNPARRKLSDESVIGLIGELTFIKEMYMARASSIPDFWNGPLKSAQDFQGDQVAIEVKTSISNSLDNVCISSEKQLDSTDWEDLFLVVYRAERNDATGITLPELIEEVSNLLTEQQRRMFSAKLICLGFREEDIDLYSKGYSIKERRIYKVEEDFPRITRKDLPKGVERVQYQLSLSNCSDYESRQEAVVLAIKEHEYGED